MLPGMQAPLRPNLVPCLHTSACVTAPVLPQLQLMQAPLGPDLVPCSSGSIIATTTACVTAPATSPGSARLPAVTPVHVTFRAPTHCCTCLHLRTEPPLLQAQLLQLLLGCSEQRLVGGLHSLQPGPGTLLLAAQLQEGREGGRGQGGVEACRGEGGRNR